LNQISLKSIWIYLSFFVILLKIPQSGVNSFAHTAVYFSYFSAYQHSKIYKLPLTLVSPSMSVKIVATTSSQSRPLERNLKFNYHPDYFMLSSVTVSTLFRFSCLLRTFPASSSSSLLFAFIIDCKAFSAALFLDY